MWEFDLIYSIDLGIVNFGSTNLHCCFNIYVRPKTGKLNPKPNYKLNDITIVQHRRIKGNYSTGRNVEITPGFDYAICNWGSGSFGKVPEFIGQFASELYFYCHNKKYLSRMKELLQYDVIRKYVKSISASKMSVMMMYKYLKDNINGIE